MKSYRAQAELQQLARAGLRSSLHSEACNAPGAYRARAETQQFALMVLIRPLHSEAWLARGGDPAVALIGLSSSLHVEACNALGASDEVVQSAGGDPAVCSHGVEMFTAV